MNLLRVLPVACPEGFERWQTSRASARSAEGGRDLFPRVFPFQENLLSADSKRAAVEKHEVPPRSLASASGQSLPGVRSHLQRKVLRRRGCLRSRIGLCGLRA